MYVFFYSEQFSSRLALISIQGCLCYQSAVPVSVGALRVDLKWFVCVLHLLPLHPSALHLLHSANPGMEQYQVVSDRNNEIMWSLEIKAHNKRQKSLLNIHIPLDHNIHFLVSLCTGTGHSVSATRRWSDCSCLNSRERRDTDYIPHAHACTCILTAQVLERCTIGEQSDRALL